jgi:hypothetical protein
LIHTSWGHAGDRGERAGEALGVSRVSRGEHGDSGRRSILGQAPVNVVGCEQAKAGMPMLGVLGEEDVAVGPGVLDRAEALGERRPALRRLEVCLRERVVIGHVRADMGVLVTPRSPRSSAMGFEVIAGPRSASTVS